MIINLIYIIASIFLILGLKLLGSTRKARLGNIISSLGMLLAVGTVLISQQFLSIELILIGILIGSILGVLLARLIAMTRMPELVAMFNGLGGVASLLVGSSEFLKTAHTNLTLIAILLAILIGGITFTGSIVAWGKLSGVLPTKALTFPGQNIINGLFLTITLLIAIYTFYALNDKVPSLLFSLPEVINSSTFLLITLVALALLLGFIIVMPIGGADMPVVISLLNSYSGIAACATGFIVMNYVLIVAGTLVGASGFILTNIMCKAMNRSLSNVLFSAFGSHASSNIANQDKLGNVKPINDNDAYLILEAARSVVFIPGYGMAVAQAQHAIKELMVLLENNSCEVSFAIHPVAGRMPGHMNVLLAEASIPYEKLLEMNDINPKISSMDVAIIIGANDIVNPSATEDKSSPIYGMPIIEAMAARTVFVLKRSMNTGFAGIDNALFYKPNTRMLFGDAKISLQKIIGHFDKS